MKYVDLELEEPVTGERYQVQVKSQFSLTQFLAAVASFPPNGYRKMYFVVHSPDASPATHSGHVDGPVELVLPKRLAALVVDGGLTGWVAARVR